MSLEETQAAPARSAAARRPANPNRWERLKSYLEVMTRWPRRFCCQQLSLDSVQKGRSLP